MSDIGPTGWDKEAINDAEIDPLVRQLLAICKRENLPMLVSVNYRHSDDQGDGEDHYCTSYIPGNDTLKEALKIVRRKSKHQVAAFIVQQPKS